MLTLALNDDPSVHFFMNDKVKECTKVEEWDHSSFTERGVSGNKVTPQTWWLHKSGHSDRMTWFIWFQSQTLHLTRRTVTHWWEDRAFSNFFCEKLIIQQQALLAKFEKLKEIIHLWSPLWWSCQNTTVHGVQVHYCLWEIYSVYKYIYRNLMYVLQF